MHTPYEDGESTGPADLEAALWCAVDHARKYGELAVAAQLLQMLQDLPSRWRPVLDGVEKSPPTLESLRRHATDIARRAQIAHAAARQKAPGQEPGSGPVMQPFNTRPNRRPPPI